MLNAIKAGLTMVVSQTDSLPKILMYVALFRVEISNILKILTVWILSSCVSAAQFLPVRTNTISMNVVFCDLFTPYYDREHGEKVRKCLLSTLGGIIWAGWELVQILEESQSNMLVKKAPITNNIQDKLYIIWPKTINISVNYVFQVNTD